MEEIRVLSQNVKRGNGIVTDLLQDQGKKLRTGVAKIPKFLLTKQTINNLSMEMQCKQYNDAKVAPKCQELWQTLL